MAKLRNFSKASTADDHDASAAADCDHACAGRAAGCPLRRQFGFTRAEELTLDVIRCLCDVYASGSAQGWEVAMRTAESELGLAAGPLLVARVTSFVRALKSERRGSFKYLSFGCSHICDDELAILTLIKAKRLGDVGVQQNLMTVVVGGAPIHENTNRAADHLAALYLSTSARSGLPASELAPEWADAEANIRPTRMH